MLKRDYTTIFAAPSAERFYGKTPLASELCAGLCPQMKGIVRPIETAATSAVVSEYGVRHSLEAELSGCRLSGYNVGGHLISGGIIGPFSACFEYDVHKREAEFRSLSADVSYDRVCVSVLSGPVGDFNAPQEAVMIAYDGGREGGWVRRERSDFLGGGAEEAFAGVYLTSASFSDCKLGSKIGKPTSDTTGQYSLWYGKGLIPTTTILAVGDQRCAAWRTSDAAVMRVGVKVPLEKSFPNGVADKVYVGSCRPELSGTEGFRWWGWFYAPDESTIQYGRGEEGPGEWRPFYTDGFELSAGAGGAFYSTSALVVLSANPLTIGLGPGDDGYALDPDGIWRGAAEISVYYDRISYAD